MHCAGRIAHLSHLLLLALTVALVLPANVAETREDPPPLRIAYSDWPGWVAWEVAIQKGWFKQNGVDVEFKWYDYTTSMDKYVERDVDAVTITNGDALVIGSGGTPIKMILVNDYSNGNDMVVAAPGYVNLRSLIGKRIGVEFGFVSHLLLTDGFKKNRLNPADFKLVNIRTNDAVAALQSGSVEAIVAWQPIAGNALKAVKGAKAVYTSADVPGLIYDTLAVHPESLVTRRDDWAKVVKTWYQVVDYIRDGASRKEAIAIMAARVGLEPREFARLLVGTHLLNLEEALKRAAFESGYSTVYGSSRLVDDFQYRQKVYDQRQKISDYLDFGLVRELAN